MKPKLPATLIHRVFSPQKATWRYLSTSCTFRNTAPKLPSAPQHSSTSKAQAYEEDHLIDGVTGQCRASAYSLRLACTCEQCVDPSDGQKTFSIADVPRSIGIQKIKRNDDGSFQVQWSDDVPGFGQDHVSRFNYDRLSRYKRSMQGEYALPIYKRALHMWDKSSYDIESHTVSYNEYMSDEKALAKALDDIWTTGLVFVKDVPSDPTSVQKLAERIALLRNSFYGTTWDVRSKPNAENVAYTSRYLGYHMDLLYMREPPGLQLLHCIENTCDGGESFFADTFTAVHLLVKKNPIYFKALCKQHIRYAYHNGANTYAHTKRVIANSSAEEIRIKRYRGKVDDSVRFLTQTVRRVYWSPPFISSQMTRPAPASTESLTDYSDDIHQQALKQFVKILDAPELRVQTKLPAGTCAIFDNLRVVHAREAFNTNSGHRWLRGAYLDWQDFLSKANSNVHLMPDVQEVTPSEENLMTAFPFNPEKPSSSPDIPSGARKGTGSSVKGKISAIRRVRAKTGVE